MLRSTLAEADKTFLESIIQQREDEIETLKESLRVRDMDNQVLQAEKALLLKEIQ